MNKMLIVILFLAGTAQASQSVSIGTCTDTTYDDKMRVLMDVQTETEGLIVGEVPRPIDGKPSIVTALSVGIKKISDSQYDVLSIPKHVLPDGIALEMDKKITFMFSVTKDGADWVSEYRTYNCKLD